MKPSSIKKFDMLYLGAVVVGLIGFAVNYGAISERANADLAAAGMEGMAGGVMIGGLIFGVAINLALWFLVSVLRIEFVKWILALFAAYSLVSLFLGMNSELVGGLNFVFGAISAAISIAAIWYLFQPDAKAWFAEKRGAADSE